MSELAGLDPSHGDDRILATALELAHRELPSTVIVITRDRNAANKARQLELPAVDVADV
jgi:predicted ribonuclease YlaK